MKGERRDGHDNYRSYRKREGEKDKGDRGKKDGKWRERDTVVVKNISIKLVR